MMAFTVAQKVNADVMTSSPGWRPAASMLKCRAAVQEFTATAEGTPLNSCTAALHLSMLAAGLQPGDEVITSALTFCATVNAIIHSGAHPVLADIDPRTMNI